MYRTVINLNLDFGCVRYFISSLVDLMTMTSSIEGCPVEVVRQI